MTVVLPQRAMVVLVLALSGVLLLAACRRSGGAPSEAQIILRDGGAAEIVLGSRRADLPAGDVRDGAGVPVTQDERGRRLAYRTAAGMARLLYVVGDGIFVGPLVPHPPDYRAAPDLEHALGPLFEAAGPRRADLVREVRRERGDAGVARLLLDAAYVDDPAWEEARRQLAPGSDGVLREGLAAALEPGKPAVLLRRAVGAVDLRSPERAKVVAARARELASGAEEPRAVAVLLRAVIANDGREAAAIGCEVLARRPASPPEDHAKLVEAATLAIAAADADCPDPKLVEEALEDRCAPYLRCNDAGPLSWSTSSDQTEPLCTREQLAKAIASELGRSASDVLESGGARPGLFALAILLAKDRAPAAFVAGHARRRYAIAQPPGPSCDSGLPTGTPCRCDEATLRFAACNSPATSRIANGVCRFEVDDAQRRIGGVVAEPGGT